ncbi:MULTISPECIES: glycosyltransferase family A protein [Acidithrix]|uniref:UDP-Glc:alpha-D-GlcNAc-diphosphoundecaprenol beta-1,3-glucosyltransferase WfgD n=1 Tax=Acidithrix ferrooxidans TaxID=1280514 RepID=A0A0D8HJB4_9ACTN|nr:MULTISPECIES: glycosyltransferase family A protein [Acidithrix]KJF18023.1 UDP-Glc:alpha-D-GlcNAc-diphosphoundecaprenol beta-1,3-glucosyltransferase WfgD [Acidithrix ferrooxidans]CAG4918463.1 unnamed protein product [Acidithrix sp. C25]
MPNPASDQESISAIVTSYNSKGTIGPAIESVLAQSFKPQEIIVVDDGSSDGSKEIINSYSGEIQIAFRENGGPSKARNHGIELASESWLAFLDGDDIWHPKKLELQIEASRQNPDLQIIATDWSREISKLDDHIKSQRRYFAEDIAILNRFQTSTVMMKRELARSINGFDSELDSAEDWDMWLRATKDRYSLVLGAPLVFYRDSPQGVSKDLRKLARKADQIMLRESQSQDLDPQLLRELRIWHQHRLIIGQLLSEHPLEALGMIPNSIRAGRPMDQIAAFRRYTVPFLMERLKRRTKPKS